MIGETVDTHPERTTLAVHRTAATILVVSIALVRTAVVHSSVVAGVAATMAGLLSLVAVVVSRRSRAGFQLQTSPPFPTGAVVSALAVAMISIAGLNVALGAA